MRSNAAAMAITTALVDDVNGSWASGKAAWDRSLASGHIESGYINVD
jgi:hypothetical protein